MKGNTWPAARRMSLDVRKRDLTRIKVSRVQQLITMHESIREELASGVRSNWMLGMVTMTLGIQALSSYIQVGVKISNTVFCISYFLTH